MKDIVLQFFEHYPQMAIVTSLLLSIAVAVLGLLPSVFITAANILYFGFWEGSLISFIGETLGAAIAFFLYRKGFKISMQEKLRPYPTVQKLVASEGSKAFWLVVSLRLIPFIPSGLVTFAAAIGNISAIIFISASSLGKIPALLMEAYSVYQVTKFGWQGKAILIITASLILFFAIRNISAKKKDP